MYLADYHTHTQCSPDSEAPLAEMAQAAVDAGLQELCTTDHCDLIDLDGRRVYGLDWAPILAQYEAARRQFQGKLTLLLGLELGSAHVDLPAAEQILSAAPVDFVIGSVHNQSLAAGGRDFYFLDYATQADCYAALDDYFASLLALAPLPCYHALGHIIYPLRYMNGRAGHHVTLDRYRDQLDELLRTVIQTGRAIEVNTHCGDEVADWEPILLRYRQLGGELVTTGSDAHRPQHVALGIRDAQELLLHTGFRYQTIYRQGTPEQIKL